MMLCNTSYMAMSKWYWNSSNSLRLHGDVVLSSGLSIAVRDQVSALQNMRASELCMPETLASQQWQVATFHLWFVSRANIQLAIQTLNLEKQNVIVHSLQPWSTPAINCRPQLLDALPSLWIHAGSKEVAASGMEAVPSWKQSHAEAIFIDWHWDAKMDSNDSAQQNSKELYSLHASQTTLQKCSKQYTFTKWSWRLSNTVV